MCEPHRNLSAGSPLLIENCKSMGFCTMEREGQRRDRKCRRDVQRPKQNIEAVNISAMTAEQRDAALALDVERLLRFGRKHKLIKELDAIVARNTLLDLLALGTDSNDGVVDFVYSAIICEVLDVHYSIWGLDALPPSIWTEEPEISLMTPLLVKFSILITVFFFSRFTILNMASRTS